MNLVELNDDCLECIFERLSLSSQLQAARTCRRLRDINVGLWRRNRKYQTLCLDEVREIFVQENDLVYFLQLMKDHLTAIRVEDCLSAFLRDLEDMRINCMPCVERFEMLEDMECCPTGDDIHTLTVLLPNLKSLRIALPIDGQHLTKFTKLEELYLYEDQEKDIELSEANLRDICELQQLRVLDVRDYGVSKLKFTNIERCKSLQVLKLNLNALKPVLQKVLHLPHLKRLSVMLDQHIDVSTIKNVDTHDYRIYETAEFFEILKVKCEHITGLAVDNYYLPLTAQWDDDLRLLRFGKLEKFAFCSCDFSNTEEILSKYAQNSPKLKILCLRNWPLLNDGAILQFVNSCPQLQHLDVTYCRNLTKSLLFNILKILQGRDQQQQTSLHMYILHCDALEFEVGRNSNFWNAQTKVIQFSHPLPDADLGLSYIDRGYEFDFE